MLKMSASNFKVLKLGAVILLLISVQFSNIFAQNVGIDKLTAKIAASPKDDKLYTERAKAYWKLKKYARATADIDKALGINPKNSEAVKLQNAYLKSAYSDPTGDFSARYAEDLKSMKVEENGRNFGSTSVSAKIQSNALKQTKSANNSDAAETATLLRDTLNGKFGYLNNQPLVYKLKMKKSGVNLLYRIEFINDGGKLAFKWKEITKNEQSEKLIITDNALESAGRYVNFFTAKSALSPDKEIAFILSKTLYEELKAKNEINLDLGKGLQRMSYNYNMTAMIGVYTNKKLKILYFQSDDGKTQMQLLNDPICPLIVEIDTPEYSLTLEN